MEQQPIRRQVEVSIVVPMHNEQECFEPFCTRLLAVLEPAGSTYEVVLVDDGSTDQTSAMIRQKVSSSSAFRGVFLARNSGQWAAIDAGLHQSRGNYVVVMDADLQHAPEDLPKLLQKAREGWDIVSGVRSGRSESFLSRRLPSLLANFLLRTLTGCPARDMGGFKCIRGDIARSLVLRAGHHRLLPAIVYLRGGSLAEVGISAPPRLAGKSHYGIGRSVEVLFDILMLWFSAAGKARPIYSLGTISLWCLLIAAALFGWTLIDKIVFGDPMGTRPPFLLSVLFTLLSLAFLGFGLVLEFLSTLETRLTGNMPYRVRSVLDHDDPQFKAAEPLRVVNAGETS